MKEFHPHKRSLKERTADVDRPPHQKPSRAPVQRPPRTDRNVRRDMARLCSIYACDRASKEPTIDLPQPGSPECNDLFLATWEAFRYVTTELGKRCMIEQDIRGRSSNPLEAFVHGRQVPAYIRWAETEAMIRADEWCTGAVKIASRPVPGKIFREVPE